MNDQMKALVCEDEFTTLMIFEQHLSSIGFQVLKAANGVEGLEILNKNDDVEVIVSDWMMPEMDGLELLKKVKNKDKTKNIPFIMVTAKTAKEEKLLAEKYGVFRYICKPYDKDIFLAEAKAAQREYYRYENLLRKTKKSIEGIKEFAFDLIEQDRKRAEFDLETHRILDGFFMDSLACNSYESLVSVLLETVKKFSLPSAEGKGEEQGKLRCSILLNSDIEMDLSDRGIAVSLDKMILKNSMNTGEILRKGAYTAIPSKSCRAAILVRNTPTKKNEEKCAREIIQNILEMFDARLLPFETERRNQKTMEAVYNFLTKINENGSLSENIMNIMEESDIGPVLQSKIAAVCSQEDKSRQLLSQAIWGLKKQLFPDDISNDQKEQMDRLTPNPDQADSLEQHQVDDLLSSFGL